MERIEVTKYALVGTTSTGKTTTFEHHRKAQAADQSVVFIPEAAREYLEAHPDATLEDGPIGMQTLTLTKERAAHASGARQIVMDRSTLDSSIWAATMGDTRRASMLFDRVADWVPTYTGFLVFDPEGVSFTVDAVRKETLVERQRF